MGAPVANELVFPSASTIITRLRSSFTKSGWIARRCFWYPIQPIGIQRAMSPTVIGSIRGRATIGLESRFSFLIVPFRPGIDPQV